VDNLIVILHKLFSNINYKMGWSCSKVKCEKCEKYCEKCRKYKSLYLKQETKNDELIEMIESLCETQKAIAQYIETVKNKENEKVSGVNIKKITTKNKSF
tara:strand:+ start:53 stop:352 length:300 start_codon:yes stop_codon:yes gene_type:complete